jgi:hypothetical protein
MAETVYINGKAHDWGSTVIRVNGKAYEGILAVKYSHKRERTRVYGQGNQRKPIAVTGGKYNPEDGSLTVLKGTAQQIRDDLARQSADGQSYGDARFPITVQYIEDGVGPIKDEVLGCWIAGDDGGGEEGSADPTKEEIPFGCMEIKKNGKTLYAAKRR